MICWRTVWNPWKWPVPDLEEGMTAVLSNYFNDEQDYHYGSWVVTCPKFCWGTEVVGSCL